MDLHYNKQHMFGNKELEILKQDNYRIENKPLQMNYKMREPSKVQEDMDEDSGIVGYMGDDEDIEQAQYNVMSLLTDKLGGVDDRIDKLLQQTETVKQNKEKLERLEREYNSLRVELTREEEFIEDELDELGDGNGSSMCDTEYAIEEIKNSDYTGPCTLDYQGDYVNQPDEEKIKKERSCSVNYSGSSPLPVGHRVLEYCYLNDGVYKQKCNTMIGDYANASPPLTEHCISIDNTDDSKDKLWVENCKIKTVGDCVSDECELYGPADDQSCIYKCRNLTAITGKTNIFEVVDCRYDSNIEDYVHKSSDLIDLAEAEKIDQAHKTYIYCKQFSDSETGKPVSESASLCESHQECIYNDNADVDGLETTCMPKEDCGNLGEEIIDAELSCSDIMSEECCTSLRYDDDPDGVPICEVKSDGSCGYVSNGYPVIYWVILIVQIIILIIHGINAPANSPLPPEVCTPALMPLVLIFAYYSFLFAAPDNSPLKLISGFPYGGRFSPDFFDSVWPTPQLLLVINLVVVGLLFFAYWFQPDLSAGTTARVIFTRNKKNIASVIAVFSAMIAVAYAIYTIYNSSESTTQCDIKPQYKINPEIKSLCSPPQSELYSKEYARMSGDITDNEKICPEAYCKREDTNINHLIFGIVLCVSIPIIMGTIWYSFHALRAAGTWGPPHKKRAKGLSSIVILVYLISLGAQCAVWIWGPSNCRSKKNRDKEICKSQEMCEKYKGSNRNSDDDPLPLICYKNYDSKILNLFFLGPDIFNFGTAIIVVIILGILYLLGLFVFQ